MFFGNPVHLQFVLLRKLEQIREKYQLDIKSKDKNLYDILYNKDVYKFTYDSCFLKTKKAYPTELIQDFIAILKTRQATSGELIKYMSGQGKKINLIGQLVRIVSLLSLRHVYDLDFNYSSPTKHQVLRTLNQRFNSVDWCIVGKCAYPSVKQLVSFLSKYISDTKFLYVLEAILLIETSRLVEIDDFFDESSENSLLYLVLTNFYLHQMDVFFEKRKNTYLNQKVTVRYPQVILDKIVSDHKFLALRASKVKADAQLIKTFSDIPRLEYIRYQCTWLVGICGKEIIAKDISREIAGFLKSKALSTIEIVSPRSKNFLFLGYLVGFMAYREPSGIFFRWGIRMEVPIDYVLRRLHERGFCSLRGDPFAKNSWVYLNDIILIGKFVSLLKRIVFYYSGADNKKQIIFLKYILVLSCARTLARKHNLSVLDIFDTYGRELCYCSSGLSAEGGSVREVCLNIGMGRYLGKSWNISDESNV